MAKRTCVEDGAVSFTILSERSAGAGVCDFKIVLLFVESEPFWGEASEACPGVRCPLAPLWCASIGMRYITLVGFFELVWRCLGVCDTKLGLPIVSVCLGTTGHRSTVTSTSAGLVREETSSMGGGLTTRSVASFSESSLLIDSSVASSTRTSHVLFVKAQLKSATPLPVFLDCSATYLSWAIVSRNVLSR